ncbi:MAG: 6,7-dimethyl-8-ribityllumazine synthase [Longispora sp.]|nr:6,7-dimethyl-8-ribityllumazine synthase [Longispora sp. (in: high G+C Gram-positive bacteria)]
MAGFGADPLGTVDASGLSLGIVAARWHADITDSMVSRAEAAAKACGVAVVDVRRVAGSVELPIVAQALAEQHDAVIAFGVILRGETGHYGAVCDSVNMGLTRVALDTSTPVGHGVLMVNDIDQARNRAGLPGSAEDKGWSYTVAVLDAALTLRDLRSP